MKAKENPNDQSIFYDDLRAVIDSSKLFLSPEEVKAIYQEYSNGKPKMNPNLFLEHLIPLFNKSQAQKIDMAYQKL